MLITGKWTVGKQFWKSWSQSHESRYTYMICVYKSTLVMMFSDVRLDVKETVYAWFAQRNAPGSQFFWSATHSWWNGFGVRGCLSTIPATAIFCSYLVMDTATCVPDHPSILYYTSTPSTLVSSSYLCPPLKLRSWFVTGKKLKRVHDWYPIAYLNHFSEVV